MISLVNTLVGALERLGAVLWQGLAPLTLSTGLLLAAAYALDRALERKVAAAVRVVLYAPIVVRLFLPVAWASPLGLLGGHPGGGASVSLGPITVAAASAVPAAPTPGPFTLAALVYLLVAAALAVRGLLVHRSLGRQLAGAPVLPVQGPTPLVQHDRLGPMVVGLLRPRIVVPRALLAAGQEETLALVLRHESAHVQRRDYLLAAALHALCIVAWPLLPVWLAARRLRLLMEYASDERALAGAAPPVRRRYGEALLALAQAPFARRSALVPSFGSPLAGRLRALGWRRRWPLGVQLVPVLVAGGLALACAGAPEGQAPEGTPPATAATGPRDRVAPEARIRRPPPAPDVIPGAAVLQGSLDKEIIRRIIRRHIDEVKACYEAALPRAPDLGGRVVVRFTIGAEGRVVHSELGSSTLGDPQVQACLVDVVRTWEFPKPLDGGIVIVAYPFSFTPRGQQPGASSSEATVRRRTSTRLPAEHELSRAFAKAAAPTVKRCYEKALAQDKGRASIHLEMTVHLAPKPGLPHAVTVTGTDDRGLLDCLETEVAMVDFPTKLDEPTALTMTLVLQGAQGK